MFSAQPGVEFVTYYQHHTEQQAKQQRLITETLSSLSFFQSLLWEKRKKAFKLLVRRNGLNRLKIMNQYAARMSTPHSKLSKSLNSGLRSPLGVAVRRLIN